MRSMFGVRKREGWQTFFLLASCESNLSVIAVGGALNPSFRSENMVVVAGQSGINLNPKVGFIMITRGPAPPIDPVLLPAAMAQPQPSHTIHAIAELSGKSVSSSAWNDSL